MHLPIFLLLLFAILLLALLLLCVGTVFAALRLFAARDAQGNRKPLGCALGGLLALGLFLLGVVGLLIFAGSMLLFSVGSVLASNPVSRVRVVTTEEVGQDPLLVPHEEVLDMEPFEHDPARPLHVLLEVQGESAPVEEIVAWVRRFARGEVRVRTRQQVDAQGRPVVLVDVSLPANANDLRELEEELSRHLPEVRWNEGVLIELRGVRRDF